MDFIRGDTTYTKELRNIAHFSEAYWGYEQPFMDVFDKIFNITDEFIRNNTVYMRRDHDRIVCFWGAICKGNICELEYFYVSPEQINTGLGKVMWKNFISWAQLNKIKEISFVTRRESIGFYEKMGAILVGEVLSSIDNRLIPKFELQL